MLKQSFALVGFGALVNALQAPVPSPTNNIANALGFGFDLLPTAAAMLPGDLLKRQAGSGSLIGYIAPDNTCGYVSGVQASIKTCATSESCAAIVVSGVASMGCCDGKAGTCQFLGNCIGSVGYFSSSLCGAACQADINTLKCTAASKPYCYSYLVPSMTMGFFSCASTFSASFAPFLTTYSGQASVSWKKVYDSAGGAGASGVDPIFAATSKGLNNGAGFSSVITSAPSGSTSPAGSKSDSSTETSSKKSTPLGPIIGGVVGGLLLIGVGAAAVLFLCIKKRNQKKNEPPVMNGGNVISPMMQQQVPQQQMMSPYQGYDPNSQQGFDPNNQQGFQNGQNGYAQYPSPQQTPNGYGYYGGAAAVGQNGQMDRDAKVSPYDSVSPVPVSPAPQYNPTQSPLSGTGPSPAISHAEFAGPPAVYHEVPGTSVQPQNGYTPSPQLGAAQIAGSPQQQNNAPVELGGVSRAIPNMSPQQQANMPVELGTNPIAPRQNAQGHQVYEMGN